VSCGLPRRPLASYAPTITGCPSHLIMHAVSDLGFHDPAGCRLHCVDHPRGAGTCATIDLGAGFRIACNIASDQAVPAVLWTVRAGRSEMLSPEEQVRLTSLSHGGG
jgi:hypothetical protein